jgi:hypothetical protein
MTSNEKAKDQRLAEALRANLNRRKAQSRDLNARNAKKAKD